MLINYIFSEFSNVTPSTSIYSAIIFVRTFSPYIYVYDGTGFTHNY